MKTDLQFKEDSKLIHEYLKAIKRSYALILKQKRNI